MDGVEVYRWFLTASPFGLRIVYFNSQLVDFMSQTAMRSRINYALQTTINKESSESFSLLLIPVELHSNFSIANATSSYTIMG